MKRNLEDIKYIVLWYDKKYKKRFMHFTIDYKEIIVGLLLEQYIAYPKLHFYKYTHEYFCTNNNLVFRYIFNRHKINNSLEIWKNEDTFFRESINVYITKASDIQKLMQLLVNILQLKPELKVYSYKELFPAYIFNTNMFLYKNLIQKINIIKELLQEMTE